MPSMILRDWALASSGLLEARTGGAPVYPYQPDEVWEALAITKERGRVDDVLLDIGASIDYVEHDLRPYRRFVDLALLGFRPSTAPT